MFDSSSVSKAAVHEFARQGQIVWVRDPDHASYTEWGMAVFNKVAWHERLPYHVMYLNEDGTPMRVGGLFPEISLKVPDGADDPDRRA